MPAFFSSLALLIFSLALLMIFIRSFTGLILLKQYQPEPPAPRKIWTEEEKKSLPFQVIQIPTYNEDPARISRLLNSVLVLSYPSQLMLIQVLDDSNIPDIQRELNKLIKEKQNLFPKADVRLLRRNERIDHKAGNLNFGLHQLLSDNTLNKELLATALVSIFDADFVVPPEFLLHTTAIFDNPEVVAVQCGIEFSNRRASIVAESEAIFLDNLYKRDFSIRSQKGLITTFLGSGGTWRLETLHQLGGWSGDTLIEDMDASLAAQIRGGHIVYLDHPRCSSELPQSLWALKLQQRSWMKGVQQVFHKHRRSMLKNRSLTWRQKFWALELFWGFSMQPLMLLVVLVLYPAAQWGAMNMSMSWALSVFMYGLIVATCASQIPFISLSMKNENSKTNPKQRQNFLKSMQILGMSLGMVPVYATGTLEGLFGLSSKRYRTIRSAHSHIASELRSYHTGQTFQQMLLLWTIDAVLAIYALFSLLVALQYQMWAAVLFLAPIVLSFCTHAIWGGNKLIDVHKKF